MSVAKEIEGNSEPSNYSEAIILLMIATIG